MTPKDMTRQRIEEIAAEYRGKGYGVTIAPDASDLPAFLAAFRPDIIAKSDLGNVVVEVRSARDFDGDEVQRLAEAVETQSRWKFEVVLVTPPVAPDVPAQEELAAEEQVNRLITNAEMLAKQNQTEAAALLAWSAVEAILRRSARSTAPEVERSSSARVLKHLYSLGHVQPDVYERLSQLMRFRNAVAHGFEPSNGAPSLIELLSDIRRMQAAA